MAGLVELEGVGLEQMAGMVLLLVLALRLQLGAMVEQPV